MVKFNLVINPAPRPEEQGFFKENITAFLSLSLMMKYSEVLEISYVCVTSVNTLERLEKATQS